MWKFVGAEFLPRVPTHKNSCCQFINGKKKTIGAELKRTTWSANYGVFKKTTELLRSRIEQHPRQKLSKIEINSLKKVKIKKRVKRNLERRKRMVVRHDEDEDEDEDEWAAKKRTRKGLQLVRVIDQSSECVVSV